MTTAAQMIEFLRQKAGEAWADGNPYFLSNAGPDLTVAEIPYRDILDGEKMKDFVVRTSGDAGYQLVQHPVQRAKLGLVPAGVSFAFEERNEDADAATTIGDSAEPRRGAQLLAFLDMLSRLPREDLDEIIIPTRVLVKLARKK